MNTSAQRNLHRSRLSLGIVLVALGLLLVVGGPKKDSQPRSVEGYSFESEPVEVQGFTTGKIEDKETPARIVVPDLKIDLKVSNSEVIGGYWQVFEDKAGWGIGSGFPGEAGNQVIFAHAREGLFLPLKDVKLGMRVYVLSDQNWHSYKVDEINEVYPNQTEVIAPSDDERLTLYTCSGFNDSKRLIVIAKRV